MSIISLLSTTTTTLYRADLDNFHYGTDGKPVFEETPITTFQCSIQPYRDGDNTFRTPEGFYSLYGIKVYTESKIIPNDELLKTVGDEIEFEGNRFVCVDYANFTGYGDLVPEHYLGLFYRKDKM